MPAARPENARLMVPVAPSVAEAGAVTVMFPAAARAEQPRVELERRRADDAPALDDDGVVAAAGEEVDLLSRRARATAADRCRAAEDAEVDVAARLDVGVEQREPRVRRAGRNGDVDRLRVRRRQRAGAVRWVVGHGCSEVIAAGTSPRRLPRTPRCSRTSRRSYPLPVTCAGPRGPPAGHDRDAHDVPCRPPRELAAGVRVQRRRCPRERNGERPRLPRASVRDAGEHDGVNPVSRVTAALYVAAAMPTFVTFRVTVWMPARSPIAIDATFRSLASVEYPAARQRGAGRPRRPPSSSRRGTRASR